MMALLRPQSHEDDLFLRPVPTTPTATVATLAPTAEAASKDGDRPFQCNEPSCGRRFNRKFTLSEHMKTHTGEKPYVCPILVCSKRFSTSGNLARHKRLHASIKPFECSIDGCKRSFPNELKLQQHLKIHLGGKTHMCKAPGCGKSFSTAGNLTRHMKNHHHGSTADYRHDSPFFLGQHHNGSMASVFHHPHDVHSPVSVANTSVMVGDQYSAYSLGAASTHVPLTSYASHSNQSFSHAPVTQPSMADLYYSYNQTESTMAMHASTHHVTRVPAGYAPSPFQQQPVYEEIHSVMPTMAPHEGASQNLFDDVIQFQLAHPRMV